MFHFSVSGRVDICVVVIIVFIALITGLSVFLVRHSVGEFVGVIVGSVLSLKDWVPVYVSDVESPDIAAGKTMHDVDDVLWE